MISPKKIVFFALFCCFTSIVTAQPYINVDDTKNATYLVNLLTNNSSCLNLSNQTVKGDLTTGKISFGSFDKNGSGFPFDNGIVLSTWGARNSEGPFIAANSRGGISKWAGDTDLETALGITPTTDATVNATILEFDFTPQTNFISFNYIFASNEYQNEYPCNYSDGFAFLIKEDTATNYTNLAVIPGTTTPVSSQNIHPVINSSGNIGGTIYSCNAANQSYFNGYNTNSSPINYAGQTTPMTAQTTVIPGNKYHIKIVVADSRNNYYDSAVFLKAGSFSSKIDLGPDQTFATNHPACFDELVTLDATVTGATNYKWFKNNVVDTSQTNPTYTVSADSDYKVEVAIPGCALPATGEIKIQYAAKIQLTNTSLAKCVYYGNGTATFDLTKAEAIIKGTDASLTKINYYSDSALTNEILNPTAFIKTNPMDEIVYAKVTSNTYNCTEVAQIKLQTISSSLSSAISAPPIINDFSGNGNSVTLIAPSGVGPFEYSLEGINYQDSPLFTNLAVGDYTAFVRDKSNCEYLVYAITLLDYPRFFTPNGDTQNDTWGIKNLYLYPKASINIFDRYGKLLKNMDATSSWDGKYIGNDLPADDYWFHLNLDDGRIIKGHFSLKR